MVGTPGTSTAVGTLQTISNANYPTIAELRIDEGDEPKVVKTFGVVYRNMPKEDPNPIKNEAAEDSVYAVSNIRDSVMVIKNGIIKGEKKIKLKNQTL